MKEFELRKPVCDWVLSRGMVPVLEMASLNNCDIVGAEFSSDGKRTIVKKVIAIELKLTDATGVLKQCQTHLKSRCINEVWAAMTIEQAHRHFMRFNDCGVGLLGLRFTKSGQWAVEIRSNPVVKPSADFQYITRALKARRDEYLYRFSDPMMRGWQARQKQIAQTELEEA